MVRYFIVYVMHLSFDTFLLPFALCILVCASVIVPLDLLPPPQSDGD